MRLARLCRRSPIEKATIGGRVPWVSCLAYALAHSFSARIADLAWRVPIRVKPCARHIFFTASVFRLRAAAARFTDAPSSGNCLRRAISASERIGRWHFPNEVVMFRWFVSNLWVPAGMAAQIKSHRCLSSTDQISRNWCACYKRNRSDRGRRSRGLIFGMHHPVSL